MCISSIPAASAYCILSKTRLQTLSLDSPSSTKRDGDTCTWASGNCSSRFPLLCFTAVKKPTLYVRKTSFKTVICPQKILRHFYYLAINRRFTFLIYSVDRQQSVSLNNIQHLRPTQRIKDSGHLSCWKQRCAQQIEGRINVPPGFAKITAGSLTD